MYTYSEDNAKVYSKLGISGTTYEPGFNEAKKVFGDLNNKKLLDYGSGAGRTAQLLLSFGAAEVVGVDHNQSMIDQAKKSDIKNVDFVLIKNEIPFPENTFDGALCAHVMVEVSSLNEMEHIMSEIYRVLKPSASLVIITNNSKAIGEKFISFEYEKQKSLVSGQKIPIVIKGEKHFVIEDYYWTEEDYKKILEKVGFTVVDMSYPKMLKDESIAETRIAPHVVIKSTK